MSNLNAITKEELSLLTLEQLFELLFKVYWYVDIERRGEDIFINTVDPDIIMSMASVHEQVTYHSDADYVDRIVDLRSALTAAILATTKGDTDAT